MKLDIEGWKVNNFENEMQFQCKAIELISYFFPKLRDRVFHPKNEVVITREESEKTYINDSSTIRKRKDDAYNTRCARLRNRWIAEGMLPGVPDIIILYKGIRFCIELKMLNGKLNDAQKKIHATWNEDFQVSPIQVSYNLYHVYMYCKWILNLGIDVKIIMPNGSFELNK